MRLFAMLAVLGFGIVVFSLDPTASAQIIKEKKVDEKAGEKDKKDKVEPKKEEKFDQAKEDLKTLQTAGVKDDVESMLKFIKNLSATETDRVKLTKLVKDLGSEDFKTREAASEELAKASGPAIGILKQALKDSDPEIVWRAEAALKTIEKVPTRAILGASFRLLGSKKGDGITETLLNYLPSSEDESLSDDIRGSLAKLAVVGGKADPFLEKALDNKNDLLRGAAAEAFAASKEKAIIDMIKKFAEKEKEPENRLRIQAALILSTRDKALLGDLIKITAENTNEKLWRGEELLFRIAGEKAPTVGFVGDKAAKDKAVEEWNKWLKENGEKLDLAKLDAEDQEYGLILVLEYSNRGRGGRVVALGPDGKERWKVEGVQFPTDAHILPGQRILVAEQNLSRIVERDITGNTTHWTVGIQQPVACGKLPNGNVWGVGRQGIKEFNRDKKEVFSYNRNFGDICAGVRTKNGEYVLLTQNGLVIRINREGKEIKNFQAVNDGVNYYGALDLIPGGKILVGGGASIKEFDLETGKAEKFSANFGYTSSVQRLRNGNTLIGDQNGRRVIECDRDGKATKFSYQGTDAGYQTYRAFKR